MIKKVSKRMKNRVLVGLMALTLALAPTRIIAKAHTMDIIPGNLMCADQWDKFNETKDYLEKYFKFFKVDIVKFDNIFVFYDKDGDGVYNKKGQNGDSPMANVKISINHWSNPTSISPFTYSNINGKASFYFPVFNNTLDGYYLSVEVPEGYEINVTEGSIFGKDGKTSYSSITYKIGKGQRNGQGHGNLLTFAGKSEIMIPVVKKQKVEKSNLTISNKDYKNRAVEGVAYDLFTYENGQFTKAASAKSDKKGNVVFKDIPVGSAVYVKATNLEELKLQAFEGIGADALSGFITINKGNNNINVKFLKTSSLTLQQKYLSTGEPVTIPITYELYDIQGEGDYKLLGEAKADSNGVVNFSNIVVGKYVFVKAKDVDYDLLQPVEGLGNSDAQSAPIEITEAPVHLDINYQKTSSLVVKSRLNYDGQISGNLTYSLYDIKEDGSVVLLDQQVSEQGADVVFDKILVGKYVYVEVMDYSNIEYKSVSGLGNDDGKSAPIAIVEEENVLEVIYY
ncbi:MAG: hypothetical protein GX206_10415 [Clostridiales bacterium]|nr:hypothetical protein [Clostridiales bacterium]